MHRQTSLRNFYLRPPLPYSAVSKLSFAISITVAANNFNTKELLHTNKKWQIIVTRVARAVDFNVPMYRFTATFSTTYFNDIMTRNKAKFAMELEFPRSLYVVLT